MRAWLWWAGLAIAVAIAAHAVLHVEDPGWYSYDAAAAGARSAVIHHLAGGAWDGAVLASAPPREPLLADLLAAGLLRVGLSLSLAFALTTIVALTAGAWTLHAAVARRTGAAVAVAAVWLAVLAGALTDAAMAAALPAVGALLWAMHAVPSRRALVVAALATVSLPLLDPVAALAALMLLAVLAARQLCWMRAFWPSLAIAAPLLGWRATLAGGGGFAELGVTPESCARWTVVFGAVLLAPAAQRWLDAGGARRTTVALATAALGFAGGATAAHTLDRHQLVAATYELEQARALAAVLPSDAVVLTSGARRHLVPMLTGRATLRDHDRERARLFTGRPDATDLARRLGVTHIFVGPDETRRFSVSLTRLRARFPVVYTAEGVHVFAITEPPT